MVARILQAVLLAVLLVVVAQAQEDPFLPPPDDYDWIQLTSDEWLKGELISLFDDDLTFDSDNLGVLTIDRDDVRHFRGGGSYGIRIRGEEQMAGRLIIDNQTVLVTIGGERREFARQRLVSITPSSEREIDNWSGDIALGLNVRKGNADIVEYNLLARFERRTPRSRVILDYLGNFNETEGIEVANNHRLNGSLDRFSGGRLFWRPLIAQYFRDPFQNISHQATIETGLGYEVIDTSKTEWTISGGAGVNIVRRESVLPGQPDDGRSPAISVGTDFETELTSWMDYLLIFQATLLDEESGQYQHHLLTTLSTDLIGNLDLDVSLVWDRTQKPPPREDGSLPERDDYRLMVGLSFEF